MKKKKIAVISQILIKNNWIKVNISRIAKKLGFDRKVLKQN